METAFNVLQFEFLERERERNRERETEGERGRQRENVESIIHDLLYSRHWEKKELTAELRIIVSQ